MAHLPAADVVILGEVHDNPVHHEGQAQAVSALSPVAIVFEMLTEEQASRATPDIRGEPAALAAELGWADSGWPDFEMYYPIFAAAPGAAIYGGALAAAEVRRAVNEGAAGVFGSDAPLYGLDRPLAADELDRRLAMQDAAHCDAMPDEILPGMVEAQRLRDAALARATLTALDETGGPVVVITGNGHARNDQGMPVYLAAARDALEVVTVGQLEAPPATSPPYDFWRVTEPAPRDDPCAAFR